MHVPPAAGGGQAGPSRLYRAFLLSLLVIVYAFNFLDRQIIGILAIPIQTEMHLSDWQLGLMRGVSFALFYATLGVPIAWAADRLNRVRIIAFALFFWSLFTACCGLARNFPQLFLIRMGVGIGEAGGVAPSYSIVADYFPKAERARAMAVYALGIPIGSAIGVVFGGVVATLFDWRTAFLATGAAGILFVPIFLLVMREPQRGRFDRRTGAGPEPGADASLWAVLRTLAAKPSFFLMSLGASLSSMMGYGLYAWLPAFFVRSYKAELPKAMAFLPAAAIPAKAGPLLYASYLFGGIALIGGVLGILAGGWAADRFGARSPRAYALAPAIAFLGAAPLLALGVLTHNLWLASAIFVVQAALSLAWLGPVTAAFQMMAPVRMRTTAAAIFLLINNLIGLGLGDLVLGAMSDGFARRFHAESLRYSLLAGAGFYVLAFALFVLAATRIERDWET